MPDITIPVPEERVPVFYRFFGHWLEGSLSFSGGASRGNRGAPGRTTTKPWGTTAQDVADAALLWRKYSPPARAMFSLLMDNPDKELTGNQIAEAINLSTGAAAVAGLLPGRSGTTARSDAACRPSGARAREHRRASTGCPRTGPRPLRPRAQRSVGRTDVSGAHVATV